MSKSIYLDGYFQLNFSNSIFYSNIQSQAKNILLDTFFQLSLWWFKRYYLLRFLSNLSSDQDPTGKNVLREFRQGPILNPSRPNSVQGEKISLNFYFHFILWYLKKFYEGL